MRRRFIKITFPIVLLIGAYFLGPAPARPVYSPALPNVPSDPDALVRYVADAEAKHKLKFDNEAKIIWSDSSRRRTEYAVVYLHGFSASRMEGDPVHRNFASRFGCNLFLSRLADHGIDTTEALLQFTPDRLWESAKEALVIGKQLGDKVILMGTSTGSTMALRLAAQYPDDVFALINLSPNIAINNSAVFITNDPWGLQISRLVKGGQYNYTGGSEEEEKYWYLKYRLEAVGQLEELLETSMKTKVYNAVRKPTLTLYYYKNEQEQDQTVRVDAMLTMQEELGTPPEFKRAQAIPNAGAHAIGSSLVSKDIPSVEQAVYEFAVEKLGMVEP